MKENLESIKALNELLYFLGFLSRKKISAFVLFSITLALFDLGGIASVGAYASVLIQGKDSKVTEILNQYLGISLGSDNRYVLLLGLVLLAIFLFKTILTVAMQRWISLSTKGIESKVLGMLGRVYLGMPYESYLTKDRSFAENLLYAGGNRNNSHDVFATCGKFSCLHFLLLLFCFGLTLFLLLLFLLLF